MDDYVHIDGSMGQELYMVRLPFAHDTKPDGNTIALWG
jgi:hypothetical protein